MTDTEHTYRTHLMWEGSTGAGYTGYGRGHTAIAPPAITEIALSAGPQFRGDSELTNPEQLLVMAASSCQLLSFLAIAARHDVDVLTYDDEAVGVMPADSTPMRITTITLAPRIVVAGGTDIALVEWMVQQAHEACYIANSLTTEVTVAPRVIHR